MDAQQPDVFGLYEVEGATIFGELVAQMPGYTFQITEGQQTQEILIGVRKGLTAFITQKTEFRSGTTHMRPGQLVTVVKNGVNYSLLFLHLASGPDPRGMGLRDDMLLRAMEFRRDLDKAYGGPGQARYLFLGDLNTMGCDECAPAISSREEVTAVTKRLLAGGVRVVPADAGGSELYRGQLTLLDHALAATAMRELPPNARSHMAGACAAGAAALSARAAKKVRRNLSDHCPLVLDLSDRDLD
jgi:hypothetical protein